MNLFYRLKNFLEENKEKRVVVFAPTYTFAVKNLERLGFNKVMDIIYCPMTGEKNHNIRGLRKETAIYVDFINIRQYTAKNLEEMDYLRVHEIDGVSTNGRDF